MGPEWWCNHLEHLKKIGTAQSLGSFVIEFCAFQFFVRFEKHGFGEFKSIWNNSGSLRQQTDEETMNPAVPKTRNPAVCQVRPIPKFQHWCTRVVRQGYHVMLACKNHPILYLVLQTIT